MSFLLKKIELFIKKKTKKDIAKVTQKNCTHFKCYVNTKQNDKCQSSTDEPCQKNETIKNGNTEKFYFKKEKFICLKVFKKQEKNMLHVFRLFI